MRHHGQMSLRGQGRGWKNVDLFEREARLLRGLKHPGIPDLVDAFDVDTPTDRTYVLVQRLAPGATLQALVEGGRWRPDEAEIERIAARLLDILTYLHGRRPPVIHRDIKPSNLVYDPSSGDVFLIDFGAVRETLLDGSTMVGTFGYMSPEQYMGRTTAVSDLYSLGATLLFLLSGRTPSDLPQRGLRVDWESVVVTGPRMRALLGAVLDPDPDARVPDAQQAAALLRGETLRASAAAATGSTSTLLVKRGARTPGVVGGFVPRRKPAGTRVEVVRNGTQSLLVDVPPMSLRGEALLMAGFATFWLGFVGVWTSGPCPVPCCCFLVAFLMHDRLTHIRNATSQPLLWLVRTYGVAVGTRACFPVCVYACGVLHVLRACPCSSRARVPPGAPLMAAFSIPFWAVGGGLAKNVITTVVVRMQLSITPREWRLASTGTRGRQLGVVEGATEDLELARCVTAATVNEEELVKCIELVEGVRTHRLGIGLKEPELLWVMEEINAFLADAGRAGRQLEAADE
jgi:hypothetical protein